MQPQPWLSYSLEALPFQPPPPTVQGAGRQGETIHRCPIEGRLVAIVADGFIEHPAHRPFQRALARGHGDPARLEHSICLAGVEPWGGVGDEENDTSENLLP